MFDIVMFNSTDSHMTLFKDLPKQIYKNPPKETYPPHLSYLLALHQNSPIARLSCHLTDDLSGIPKPCGIIGHYETTENTAGVLLLNKTKELLTHQNAKIILGPINGSTWERYRLLLPKGPEEPTFHPPTFLGEPQNPQDYPLHFIQAGFSVIDNYESRIVHDLTTRQSKIDSLKNKMDRLNITTYPIDLEHFDEQLHDIFLFSLQSFSNNPFYQPIDFEHFKLLYKEIKPYLDPDFILLSRDKEGTLVGFIFAYPDLLSLQTGGKRRLIFKTFAVSDKFRVSGLSLFLYDILHLKAHEKGYESVIHALMHSDNNSLRFSKKGNPSELFNRYALFGCVNLPAAK